MWYSQQPNKMGGEFTITIISKMQCCYYPWKRSVEFRIEKIGPIHRIPTRSRIYSIFGCMHKDKRDNGQDQEKLGSPCVSSSLRYPHNDPQFPG